MDKKGITTVMVVALVFVLFFVIGVLIYFFFFGPPVAEEECGAGTGMHLLSLAGKEDICYDQQREEIHFTVENGFVTPLEGVYVIVEGQDGEKVFLEEQIITAGAFVGKVKYRDPISSLKLIQLLPVILLEDEQTACLDEILEKTSLEACSFG